MNATEGIAYPVFAIMTDTLGLEAYGVGPVTLAFILGLVITTIITIIGKRMGWFPFEQIWW